MLGSFHSPARARARRVNRGLLGPFVPHTGPALLCPCEPVLRGLSSRNVSLSPFRGVHRGLWSAG